jgi:hypothetical protein
VEWQQKLFYVEQNQRALHAKNYSSLRDHIGIHNVVLERHHVGKRMILLPVTHVGSP